MKWNDHSALEGTHAYLGASQCSWLNYDDEKMARTYKNFLSTQKGTELHDLAARLISLKVKLPESTKTLNQYVNDAIGFDLRPEQVLYYSPYCYGTTDAIRFDEDTGFLRIHDLKTGVITKPHPEQLRIYAALFCLEYDVRPSEIDMELRLYYKDEILIDNAVTKEEIAHIMDKIMRADKILRDVKGEFR